MGYVCMFGQMTFRVGVVVAKVVLQSDFYHIAITRKKKLNSADFFFHSAKKNI